MRDELSESELAEAIERLLFYGPRPSDSLRYLDFPGLIATMGSHPDPNHNRVGLSRLPDAEADEAIARLVATYRSAGHGLVWYLTPSSRPADLGARLSELGLQRDANIRLAGLAFSPLGEQPTTRPSTDVRTVDLSELRAQVHVMAEGFGTTVEHSLATLDRLAAGTAPGYEFVQYLSFENGSPVAFATGMLDHDHKVMLLGGGATLPAHRGRGHYRALVHARIEDARARGSLAVVTQSVRTTSAPILLRLGFREVVSIERHVLPAPAT